MGSEQLSESAVALAKVGCSAGYVPLPVRKKLALMTILSIITTTCNAAATLRHCLASLSAQEMGRDPCAASSPFELEHVIVDGGSHDGTLEIIREYCAGPAAGRRFPPRWVSEPDQGLYDALNKGIGMASGEVIGILHADDYYADERVLSRVAQLFEDPAVQACYGDLLYVTTAARGESPARVVRYWKAGPYRAGKFSRGWMPPHPTFFVRKAVYAQHGLFSLELGTAADYELMLRFLVRHGITCRYIPEVLVCMRTGGMSNATLGNRLRANRMDRAAWRVNGLRPAPWTIALKPIRKIPQYFLRP